MKENPRPKVGEIWSFQTSPEREPREYEIKDIYEDQAAEFVHLKGLGLGSDNKLYPLQSFQARMAGKGHGFIRGYKWKRIPTEPRLKPGDRVIYRPGQNVYASGRTATVLSISPEKRTKKGKQRAYARVEWDEIGEGGAYVDNFALLVNEDENKDLGPEVIEI